LPSQFFWLIGYYSHTVNFIQKATKPDEAIFIFPNDSILYFLAERKNPFPFWSTHVAIKNATEAQEVIKQLKMNPPSLIIHETHDDKNSTVYSDIILRHVKNNYQLIWQKYYINGYKPLNR